jgi:hypothetical protein
MRRPGRRSDRRDPFDGEALGRQAGIPPASRVLAHRGGHDRHGAPVAGHDQAAMAAVAQLLQRGRAHVGTIEAGRQFRSYLAGSGMFASHQRTGALDGCVVQVIGNQHQGALRGRVCNYSDCGTVTARTHARPAGRDSTRACRSRPGLRDRADLVHAAGE